MSFKSRLSSEQCHVSHLKYRLTTVTIHCKTALHEVLCQCWQKGAVPQDMRDAKIVTLYKKQRREKRLQHLHLPSQQGLRKSRSVRLQKLADRVYPEPQCGFRAKKSTIDMIFFVRQLQEKCREENMPVYVAFIDLTKAFDLVSREGLFKFLPKIGCPPKLLSIIESFHNMKKMYSLMATCRILMTYAAA